MSRRRSALVHEGCLVKARVAAAEAARDRYELTEANQGLADLIGHLKSEGRHLDTERAHFRNALRVVVIALVALGADDRRSRRALRYAAGSDSVTRHIIEDARRAGR